MGCLLTAASTVWEEGARAALRASEGCTDQLSLAGLFCSLCPYPVFCPLYCPHCGCGHPSVGEICSYLQSEPTLPATPLPFSRSHGPWRHKWQSPARLTLPPANSLVFSTPLPSSLPFALPAASGQSPGRSNCLIMARQAHGLVLLCFLLQLQGPLGAVGT